MGNQQEGGGQGQQGQGDDCRHDQSGGCDEGPRDHAEETADHLVDGYRQAMKELQVEAIKKKLAPKWRGRIDGFADAVVEAMETDWETFHQRDKAKSDFVEKVRAVFPKKK